MTKRAKPQVILRQLRLHRQIECFGHLGLATGQEWGTVSLQVSKSACSEARLRGEGEGDGVRVGAHSV